MLFNNNNNKKEHNCAVLIREGTVNDNMSKIYMILCWRLLTETEQFN